MKYRIVVEKLNDQSYSAYCPAIRKMRAAGDSIDSVLTNLRRDFFCYIHDADAEFEILVGSKGQRTDNFAFRKDFLSSGS